MKILSTGFMVVFFHSLTDVLIFADISLGTLALVYFIRPLHPLQESQKLLRGVTTGCFQLLGFVIFLCFDEKLWPVDTSVRQALRKESVQYVY